MFLYDKQEEYTRLKHSFYHPDIRINPKLWSSEICRVKFSVFTEWQILYFLRG